MYPNINELDTAYLTFPLFINPQLLAISFAIASLPPSIATAQMFNERGGSTVDNGINH